MKNLTFNTQIYSDHHFLQSLQRLTSIKLPPKIKNMEEAIYFHVNEIGDLNLPLEDDNLIIIYESLNPVSMFVNSAITGKNNKNALFDTLDSNSIDPRCIFILVDVNFNPPNNLFVYSPSTKLRKYVEGDNAAVFSMVTKNAEDTPTIRQLISLKSFFIAKNPYE